MKGTAALSKMFLPSSEVAAWSKKPCHLDLDKECLHTLYMIRRQERELIRNSIHFLCYINGSTFMTSLIRNNIATSDCIRIKCWLLATCILLAVLFQIRAVQNDLIQILDSDCQPSLGSSSSSSSTRTPR